MRTPTQTNNSLFDRFWKAYPRKEGKPKALRTFGTSGKAEGLEAYQHEVHSAGADVAESSGLGGESEWSGY